MITRTVKIVPILSLLICAIPAAAKGPTVQVTITGPGIESPIHTSEKAVVSANVWFGNHIDWESGVGEDAVVLDSDFHLFFWVSIPRGHIEMKYMVNFRWDSKIDRGVVCIPGERDPWYNLNVSTIIRGNEGGCFLATDEWGRSVYDLLPQK